MLIICEPRFKFFDEDQGTELFVIVNQTENQKMLHKEIVELLSDLFPDKVGDIEEVGKSAYGISLFDADDIDDEIQILTRYNADKNTFEVRYSGKTHNAALELYTFMDRDEYPINMVLSQEQIAELQESATDISGMDIDNIILNSADFSGGNFNGSNINNSSFIDAILIATQFTDTTLINTIFNDADMRYANFDVATINKVEFKNADLRYTSFGGATLVNVDLSGADLRYADLTSVSFAGNCILTGAKFVNLPAVLDVLIEYPPNMFSDVINEDEEEEYEATEADEEAEEAVFLQGNRAIFSSANVNAGDEQDQDQDDDEDENMNRNPPVCADIINGYDVNIQSYLDKNNANFMIQLPNSDKYECVNLNDVKKYHIKTDKSNTKYFNYFYPCKSDKPFFAFTEDNYKRQFPYIRIGSFSLLVQKPEWFPQAEVPIYRKFKLVKIGSEPSFVSETMLRHGEKGDPDYISSEWHCNAGEMDTYKLEPILEGGRLIKKRTRKNKCNNNKKKNNKSNKLNNYKKTYKKKYKSHKRKKTYKKKTRKL